MKMAGWTGMAAALLAMTLGARAADAVRYNARPGSKVTIAGTSTLHDWTMDGQIIGGHLDLPAELPSTAGASVEAHAEVSIPVRSLKSGHDGMDEVMQEAMDAKDHPKIEYHLTGMTLKTATTTGQPMELDTTGELVVNGVTNVITIPVTIESPQAGRTKVSGTVTLKMTDYKVKPPAPTIGLGFVRTGDEVKITFQWLVAQPATAGH